jgi:Cdc6-like AAA superfamily ATPase
VVFASSEFCQWESEKRSLLFCPGIPGSGKTMMASLVVDYLRKQRGVGSFSDRPKFGVAVAYCRYKEQDRQSPMALLSSLLAQLALDLPEISTSLLKRYRGESGGNRAQLSRKEIDSALDSAMSCYDYTFIVIDAIDECSAGTTRETLLSSLLVLQKRFDIRFLVTGRPHLDLNVFSHAQPLEIRATKEDICRYLDGRMLELPAIVRENRSLQRRIATHIASLVDGM